MLTNSTVFAPPSPQAHRDNTPRTENFRTWAQDVLEIKELFHARKYKRCTARCEELRESAVHPLNKTFLAFYLALSYESIGIATHVYSHKKLSTLNLAKDNFGIALQNLPQPFVDDEDEDTNFHSPIVFDSPDCATLEVMKRYQHSSPLTTTSTISPHESDFTDAIGNIIDIPDEERAIHIRSSSDCSEYSTAGKVNPDDLSVPDFTTYSPRRDIFEKDYVVHVSYAQSYMETPNATNTHSFEISSARTWTPATSGHKARLSQSLSSQHCLAEDLIPSPLFNKNSTDSLIEQTPSKAPLQLHFQEGHNRQSQLQISEFPESQDENRPPTPAEKDDRPQSRPLPPLPFNHKPNFAKQGSRLILIPSHRPKIRASAIQTLVAKFEGKIAMNQNPPPPTPNAWPRTPVTPRFKMIESAFAIHEDTLGTKRAESHHTNPNLSHRHQFQHNPDHILQTPPIQPAHHNSTSKTITSSNPISIPTRLANPPFQFPSPTPTANPPLAPSSTLSSLHSTTSYYPGYTEDRAQQLRNRNLVTFRTSLHAHLCSINARIDEVTKAQEERRKKGVERSRSFWSFDVDFAGKENRVSENELNKVRRFGRYKGDGDGGEERRMKRRDKVERILALRVNV